MHENRVFIVHDVLVLMTEKTAITRMQENNYLDLWLMPFNGLQDEMAYSRRLVGNSPKFMSLDNSINRDISHSFRFHFVLSHFFLKGTGNDEEEKKRDLVMPPQGKFPVDPSASGYWKRYRLLQC